LGIILTGMGNDGARGMKEMFERGAVTLAEDEQSSIVYGMPKEAVKMGGVSQSLPLSAMIALLQYYSENHVPNKA
jgi:two-component system chemotaxis response regulator CheB